MDRGAPVSGQILFRAANGTSQPADLSQPPHPDPWSYSLGVGLLHAPPGAVAEEKVLPVLLAASRSGMAIRMHAAPQPMNRWDDETGRIDRLKVLRSTPLLDAAALEAVRQWRYTPTLLNGVPVPVLCSVETAALAALDAAPRPRSGAGGFESIGLSPALEALLGA